MAKEQRPEVLWIGCSDSRVPAEEVTGTRPGDLFVTRNVANLVDHGDLSLLSVLQFAVHHLKVKHVVVCGHHGCGGVKAAMSHQTLGLMDKWIRPIKDTYHQHRVELEACPTDSERLQRMVCLNVLQQVENLKKTAIIQRAWKDDHRPTLHGWVYGLQDGRIVELVEVEPNAPIDDIYRFDFQD
jgi:carbonic anhydrase